VRLRAFLPPCDLRAALTLIPQEPHFFSGTIRSNLDPFARHSDDELWAAVNAVELGDAIDSLEMCVEERGENLSSGQKQLLSLSRALLRHSKVVVLDEATANVDYTTDLLVQRALKTSACFKASSMIIIAHRMQTIRECDYILVMQDGRAVEFGTHDALAGDPASRFAAMIESSSSSTS